MSLRRPRATATVVVPLMALALLVATGAGPAGAAPQSISGRITGSLSVGDIEVVAADLGGADGTVDVEAGTIDLGFSFPGPREYTSTSDLLVSLTLGGPGEAQGTYDATTGAVALSLTTTLAISAETQDRDLGYCVTTDFVIPFTGVLDLDASTLTLAATGVPTGIEGCAVRGQVEEEIAKGLSFDWTVGRGLPEGPSTTSTTTSIPVDDADPPATDAAQPITAAATFTG
ncbi:hypothetical protein PO878_00830 [Iamia majanohamensis]|uniref:Uncharacterized protein n=1 Tax=Iamia majanohamensis TaxID=467976 RepID=A0AAE9Y5N8_9ACTN|nr:hypothetical protein [Iamia majanohamensis]WCO67265.1 hypothetical protein PO878_00830 [Iamia majanohamensis]